MTDSKSAVDPAASATAGGRSLKKSVIVGLILGAVFLGSILFVPEFFVLLVAVATGTGAWELAKALRAQGWYVPRVPVSVGSFLLPPITYFFGAEFQWLGAFAIIALVIIWHQVAIWIQGKEEDRTLKHLLQDFAAAVFVVGYLPLTLSFAMLILKINENGVNTGKWWVVTYVTTVAFIDTFGYLIGRKFGKHKLAPGVSPKKTWEGLLASITAGAAVSITGAMLLNEPIWFALLFAGALMLAAVFGDLAESLIKRDLGIKDMSSWLPGHGGIMDRLDSIIPATLIAYLLLQLSIS